MSGTPACPGCERPARVVLAGGKQAFCYNPDCHVVTWNPAMSLEDLAAQMKWIDLSGLEE